MSRKPSGLGKGLEALIPKSSTTLVRVPIALIRPGATQPRRTFSEDALAELTESIREKGLLQPLLVRPRGEGYELVAGERRWRAAQLAGLAEVPVVIRDLADREALELALIENLQREDLNPVEEALGYQRLLEMDMTQEQVARSVGKARATVANALRLLQLPQAALDALEQGAITAGHARALLALPEARRLWGLGEIISRNLSVRQAEALKDQTPAIARVRATEIHPQVRRDLERQLGLKVKFTGETRGKMEIHYHSLEELETILQHLGYQS